MKLFPKYAQLQEMKAKNDALEKRVESMLKAQELLVKDILSLQESTSSYKGNDYQDYGTAVQAISDKYCNLADWGCVQTGSIINLRAAFILGEGVQVSPTTADKAEAAREMAWVKDFFSYNGLDGEMSQEIAKEVEIEGKLALNILFDKEGYGLDPATNAPWPGMVTTRFIPWTTKKYKITPDPNDYLWYKEISWASTGTAAAGKFEEPQFVYKKFGGRVYDPNDAQPKIQGCLTEIDRLDKALWDLRHINHLFASPTPYMQCKDGPEVTEFLERIKNINWRVGKLLAGTGVFSMVSLSDASGIQNLINEIELNVKIISGTTGIPIHYLGLLDLLKNRATGDNTRELIMAATAREREIWLAAFQELIEKAMTLFNEKAFAQLSPGKKLDPSRVKVEIPEITQEHWERIERVLIPAAAANIISREFVAEQIPGVDSEVEAKRREENEAKEEAAAQRELERLKLAGQGEDDEEDIE